MVDQFRSTDTWFCGGQGRSGLVARMTAMRLMHLGRAVHVIGDTTTPAIRGGDGALILSASGRTTTSIAHARAIKERQAVLAVVTCSASSELAALGDIVVTVPAATSRQFGGSLFEQTALIMLDTVALALESDDASARVAMQRRHANLE
nr:SIS domain-containing protein [Allobranchiibius huperziae]